MSKKIKQSKKLQLQVQEVVDWTPEQWEAFRALEVVRKDRVVETREGHLHIGRLVLFYTLLAAFLVCLGFGIGAFWWFSWKVAAGIFAGDGILLLLLKTASEAVGIRPSAEKEEGSE